MEKRLIELDLMNKDCSGSWIFNHKISFPELNYKPFVFISSSIKTNIVVGDLEMDRCKYARQKFATTR